MIGIKVLRRTQTMAGMCIGLALTLLGGAPSFYILVHSRSASPQYNTHTHSLTLTHTHTPTHSRTHSCTHSRAYSYFSSIFCASWTPPCAPP